MPASIASMMDILAALVLVSGFVAPHAHAFAPTTFIVPLSSPKACSVGATCCRNDGPPNVVMSYKTATDKNWMLGMASDNQNPVDSGIVELVDDEEDAAVSSTNQYEPRATPFLSQSEISDDPNLLNPDLSDPKQTRVIIYIILSLIPVLFLVPLMLGSRDLIPLDALPPVEM